MAKRSERQRIRNPKEHFTIVPNMYDDADLNVYEFRLLIHYRRVGNCYESLRTTAKKCRMGKTSVEKYRQSLAEKGWIGLAESDKGTIMVDVVDRWSSTPTGGGSFQGVRQADSSEKDVRHTDKVSATGTECPSGGTKEVPVKKNDSRRTKDLQGSFDEKHPPGYRQMHKRVCAFFGEISGHDVPEPETAKEKRDAVATWWHPMDLILKKVEFREHDAMGLIQEAYNRLTDGKKVMTIKGPISLVGTCESIIAEVKSGRFRPHGKIRNRDVIERWLRERSAENG